MFLLEQNIEASVLGENEHTQRQVLLYCIPLGSLGKWSADVIQYCAEAGGLFPALFDDPCIRPLPRSSIATFSRESAFLDDGSDARRPWAVLLRASLSASRQN